MSSRFVVILGYTALCTTLSVLSSYASADESNAEKSPVTLDPVVISAEKQLKQMPGVSEITSEDLDKTPVTNDISEILRKMPGANLTGTTSTGQRGNQRQIDLRGMGPENTLILIDGMPVLSRDSVRMGRAGERDSRGDTNWVPVDDIDSIEVIRGPAAARYGSGAAGGVVNIITKRPTKLTGSVSIYGEQPENTKEGNSFRTTFTAGGPINDKVSFSTVASYNRTAQDAKDINGPYNSGNTFYAGREGVLDKDFRGSVAVQASDQNKFELVGAYSRQSNLFAGDTQLSVLKGVSAYINKWYGKETNTMARSTLALNHSGDYSFGTSTSYIQWEHTTNKRLLEGLTGGIEGSIDSDSKASIILDNVSAKSEWTMPVRALVDQSVTFGSEFRGEYMHDPVSITQDVSSGQTISGTTSSAASRSPSSQAAMIGFFGEDNVEIMRQWTVTPGLRYDHHDSFGSHVSPSLNSTYNLTDKVSLKAGAGWAFKAPNLYQLNPDYVYKSSGNGCPVGYTVTYGGSNGCYVVGNPNLKPETSINKEVGVNFHNDYGINSGITYFHNDYRDHIQAGTYAYGGSTSKYYYFKWDNVPRAVVQGLEGNLKVPVWKTVSWNNNATYMIESKNLSNGQPLSLVPEYTINSGLDWKARDDLTVTVSGTYYGKISSATVNSATGVALTSTLARDAYGIANIGVSFDATENLHLNAGIKNILDERLLRSGEGANTYNEEGRSFYAGMKVTF